MSKQDYRGQFRTTSRLRRGLLNPRNVCDSRIKHFSPATIIDQGPSQKQPEFEKQQATIIGENIPRTVACNA